MSDKDMRSIMESIESVNENETGFDFSPEEIQRVAEQAVHEAVAYIQNQMGVAGDYASIYFSDEEGSGWSEMERILLAYAIAEAADIKSGYK